MPATPPALDGYRCIRAWAAWMIGITGVLMIAFALLGAPKGAGYGTTKYDFLTGVFLRTTSTLYYQIFAGSILGALAYALCVLAACSAVASGGVGGPAGRLAGLPNLADAASRVLFWSDGYAYAMAPVRDSAVIYPGIGFLGTVIGISIAITGLPTAMQNQDLTGLMDGLRTAFDTTLFGLVASLTLALVILGCEAALSRALARTPAAPPAP